jgi:CubicO group peptidase (beta-lactamase class C family)
LSIAPLFAVTLALTQAQRAQIGAIAATVMRDRHIPGLSLGVARGTSILYVHGFGWRDADRRLPADGYTIYPIGSLSKQFTAALILQDVASGSLSLDGGNPSIRELLDQTVGGEFVYNNANYARLGEILERTDREPFCQLVQRRITDPLRLPSTGCAMPRDAWNVAAAASSGAESIAPAAGGLVSNVPDLLTWLGALRAGRVIPSPLFVRMTESARLDGIPTHYGFGFFIDDWYGYPVAQHSGYVGGFSAEDAMLFGDDLDIVVLALRATTDLVPLAKSIAAIVEPARDRNLRALPNQPPENEDFSITRLLPAALERRFPQLGTPRAIEFLERRQTGLERADLYRVTYPTTQFRVLVRYRSDTAIDSVETAPPE